MKCLWGLLIALGFSGWAGAQNVPANIAQLMQKNQVSAEGLTLIIQDVAQEVPLVSLNAQTLRSPASLEKVLTTAAALIRLGGDYLWQTKFYADAMPDANGVIQGNLYVKGGGDPFLVEERLQQMLKDLRARGVRHITGNIVLDNSLYYLPQEARNTQSFDGNGWSAYNAVPSPLMVNFRTVKVRLSPQGKQQAAVALWPNIMNWKIDNQMTVNAGKCDTNYSPAVNLLRDERGYAVVQLTGKYSTACGARELTVVMGEESEQFYYLFHDLWYAEGGSFDGGGQIGPVPATAQPLYSGMSLPLREQIQKMNQLSNNVMTRQLLLTLGAEVYGVPGSLDKGRQAVRGTLAAFGVPVEGMLIDNGSGLSRDSRVSGHTLATLLLNLYASGHAMEFMQSLAVAGESGTLNRRFVGEALQGRVIGKTGTIDAVRGFAGYVQAQSGHVYVVVIIGNGKEALKSRALQDDVLRWVYRQ